MQGFSRLSIRGPGVLTCSISKRTWEFRHILEWLA